MSITATKDNKLAPRDKTKLHFWDVPSIVGKNDQAIVLDTFVVCTKAAKVLYRVHSEATYIKGIAEFPDDKR